ncbi:hypothetical protein [Micromonospora sp. NBC_01813]|uniref:hypothetical protein n=1 Tax=Micromonospora sp. NBC_01813 TaxID=2975988 RepID=UPI002DDBAE7B|nr:hypothetical protein [Micromonospora sp. NBC_01813]WSA08463.1 hypothetical protein OG958_30475 [Micromonospora sp. NBC_01813]
MTSQPAPAAAVPPAVDDLVSGGPASDDPSPAVSASDGSASEGSAPDGPRPAGSVAATLVLAASTVGWLGLLILSVLAILGVATDGVLTVTETAYGLPAVIFAALVAGAGVAQAVRRLADRRLGPAPVLRFVAAAGSGAVVGAGAAAGMVLGDGRGGSAVMILGWALFAGATVGGTLAGLHRRAGLLTAAAAAAALGVAVLTTGRELAKGPLLELLGAGDTPASVLAAQSRLVWATALLAGVVAGLVAFGYLHRAHRRADQVPPWPAYLVAGAGPGALLLVAEVITRVGGAQLLGLARSFSESDDTFQTMANAGRINSALVVLFVGAFTALICFGRTLPARPETGADTD